MVSDTKGGLSAIGESFDAFDSASVLSVASEMVIGGIIVDWGVAVSVAAWPWPLFTARTSKAYCVSLVRPVTVNVVSLPASLPASAPSGTSVQAALVSTVLPAE